MASIDGQIEHILSLEEDFDGEGSPAFKEETTKKVKPYIEAMYRFLAEKGITLGTPDVDPGANGTIDVHWEEERYEFLINIKVGDEPATYYGDNYGEKRFKGELHLD